MLNDVDIQKYMYTQFISTEVLHRKDVVQDTVITTQKGYSV